MWKHELTNDEKEACSGEANGWLYIIDLFIEKHPEFKLADKTRDCYVYEYQKSKSNNNDKELTIEEFNKQLNDADYGKVIYSEINSIRVHKN